MDKGAESIRLGGFRMPKSRVSSEVLAGEDQERLVLGTLALSLLSLFSSDSFLSAVQLVF